MEAVRAFNSELSSLYESRPPVSRAKMASVTKAAIKAIKFYKHVVQSVEKFILKCKPEYKVPGLYVIDSVVRQSRHQFGGEKDVFGPRFTKNIVTTFQSLLKCPPDEKGRVVRVLNLWQKNSVFPVEVIQSLLDMAADPKNMDSVLAAQRAVEKVVVAHQRIQRKAANGGTDDRLLAQQSDIVNTVTNLLNQTGEGLFQGLASGQQAQAQLQQLQVLQEQLLVHTEMMSNKSAPHFDSNLLSQIKLLTDQLLSNKEIQDAVMAASQPSAHSSHGLQDGGKEGEGIDGGGDYHHGMSNQADGARDMGKPAEPGFNKKLLDFDYGESDEDEDKKDDVEVQQFPGGVHKLLNDPSLAQHIHNVSSLKSEQLRPEPSDPETRRKLRLEQQQAQFSKEIQNQYSSYNEFPDVILVENPAAIDESFNRDRQRSGRSRDRSRSPRRRGRSRSRSRERRRSRDRYRRSRSREQEQDRYKDKERERRRKGLPPIKENHISICSTTLWFGHLAKYTSEEELKAEIENYGTTENIKMVPPRGCAFVTMMHRKEAAKALDRMKGFKLNSSALRVAWAINIGVKETPYKDFWDLELGVTYIPWDRLPANLNPLLNGAMIDEDTLPEHLKGNLGQDNSVKEETTVAAATESQETPPLNSISSFGGHNQTLPSSQAMPMMPHPMMMPHPAQLAAPNLGQLQMMGQNNPPQGLPPNLLQPPGGPGATPLSLPAGVSLPQVVSAAAAALLSGAHNLANHSSNPALTLDGSLPRLPPMDTSSPIMPPQQPGTMARPGFPAAVPFGLANLQPMLRPPVPVEERQEWPSDDKLEEEALAEMEDDDDDDMPPPGPGPLLPLQLMRMGLPAPGMPRMPLQLPGTPPRPGMMVELRQPASSPGMPMVPGPQLTRPGMLGPRLLPTAAPRDGPDGMMRPPMPDGMMRPPTARDGPDGMMRPQVLDSMMRPPMSEGLGRPPVSEGMGRPPLSEGSGRPHMPDGMMRPPMSDGMMPPPLSEGMMRSSMSDDMMRTPESEAMRPPMSEGMMRPQMSEGMMRTQMSDSMRPPMSDSMRPPMSDSMRPPLSDSMRPPMSDSMRPPMSEGMMRPSMSEGMMRPSMSEGMMRSPMSEGMMRPSMSEGMMRPSMSEGILRPQMSEGMMRPQLPQGLVGQGALGMRLGMSGPGPQGLSPAAVTLGQRLGLAGGPGMRPPIRIVLGQRPNLVRPGGPFGLDSPRLQLNDLPSSQPGLNLLDDGPLSGTRPNNGPQNPGPLQGLAMRPSLPDGRPGLLGPRPSLAVGRGIRFGPGGVNFRGPRPDFLRGPMMDKPPMMMDNLQNLSGPPGSGPQDRSPVYGEGDSPRYGEGSGANSTSQVAAHDSGLHSNTDFRGDMDLLPKDSHLGGNRVDIRTDLAVEQNGPVSGVFTGASQDHLNSSMSNSNQTSEALGGASNG